MSGMEWKFTPVGIIRCHQEKQWVDESPYEVLGTILDDRNFLTHAPQKGRENAILEVYILVMSHSRGTSW